MVELLVPVGNFEMLTVAIKAGADAVYFGIKGLNMRNLGSSSFGLNDLCKVVSACHKAGVRAYLTINTIIYEDEHDLVMDILKAAKHTGVDAVIAWDMFVIEKAKEFGLEIHLSTQASVANFEALKFYNHFGIKRFVLARELDLPQIQAIKKKITEEGLDAELEVFIHGAMCVAVSGRCFMSQIAHDKSANRGECLQMCRRKYYIKDTEEDTEYSLEGSYVMSPKDMCTMPIIDKILDADLACLKIEGRARSPEYVKTIVECYKKAIEAHKKNELTEDLKLELTGMMSEVYNRGFSTGFFQGKPMNEWAGVYGSKATTRKMRIGRVLNYYVKKGVAEVQIESNEISIGDKYYIIGPTTGLLEDNMPEMWTVEGKIEKAGKGIICFKVGERVREHDKFFKVINVEEENKNKKSNIVQNH